MRLIKDTPTKIEIRWTWLPLWLAMNPKLKELDSWMKSVCLLNGITTADAELDNVDRLVEDLLVRFFPVKGLREYLRALRNVKVEE